MSGIGIPRSDSLRLRPLIDFISSGSSFSSGVSCRIEPGCVRLRSNLVLLSDVGSFRRLMERTFLNRVHKMSVQAESLAKMSYFFSYGDGHSVQDFHFAIPASRRKLNTTEPRFVTFNERHL